MALQMDHVQKAVLAEDHLQIFSCVCTGVCLEAAQRHHLGSVGTLLLARTLAVGTLLGGTLPDDQRFSVQIAGSGPLGRIVMDVDAHGAIRAYIKSPENESQVSKRLSRPKQLEQALGHTGFINIIRELGSGEFFRTSVPIETGRVDEDLLGFFRRSDGQQSEMRVEVISGTSGLQRVAGILVQAQGAAGMGALEDFAKILRQKETGVVLADDNNSAGRIVSGLVGTRKFEIVEDRAMVFECSCSRDRVKRALGIMGEDELEKMLARDGFADVRCSFCAESYRITERELKELIGAIKTGTFSQDEKDSDEYEVEDGDDDGLELPEPEGGDNEGGFEA